MMSDQNHPLWTEERGLRIWRAPDSDFHANEIDQAEAVYTDQVLADIGAEGFNAVWLRARLAQVMDQLVLPELNQPQAARRRADLRSVIARGAEHGVKVFLFFNEPLALPVDHPFWESHPELAGERHRDYGATIDCFSLCTSHPQVQRFMRAAIDSVFGDTHGLGGVILITATEYHTHCWSHHVLRPLDDGCTTPAEGPLQCPRCRDREPAEVVGELVTIWRDAAAMWSPELRVLCWNWSWSMWYPDPQSEVLSRLPDGVGVMLDFERGMTAQRGGRAIAVDEYSLGVAGPSDRFVKARRILTERGLPVYAKLQLGTTHEIATVPNLPLIGQVYAKLQALSEHGGSGFMGTWCFGCSLTLNTAAVGHYLLNPDIRANRDTFLTSLARAYFGEVDAHAIADAWLIFAKAFDQYPFSTRFLYWSPVNVAPAYPLTNRIDEKPLGGSWEKHDWGDRFEDSLGEGWSISEIASALQWVSKGWAEGLAVYAEALSRTTEHEVQQLRRQHELSCARMIRLQLQSAANIYRLHQWKRERIQSLDLKTPCLIPLDERARSIIEHELGVAHAAASLCRNDSRLGFHQEDQTVFFDNDMIQRKILKMRRLLGEERS